MPDRPRIAAARKARRNTTRPPSRRTERDLIGAGHDLVAGMDEVGRGALAGPVSVGVVVVSARTGRLPAGLRDSKLLHPQVRERLCDPIRRWSEASAVGHASAAEIDVWGIIAALRLAGQRALAQLAQRGVSPSAVILDGHHDWLTPPRGMPVSTPTPQVLTQIKGDLRCACVAAASVLAKCERDEQMTALHADHPEFGWRANKGYAAPEHLRALVERGPTAWHRRSWALPGTGPRPGQGMMDL